MSTDTFSPSTRLVLVGAVHGDPRGYVRALKLLQALTPEVVAVEISAFSLAYRQRHQASWERLFHRALAQLPKEALHHLALQRVAAQVVWPFEVRAAQDYSREVDIPWRAIDASRIARRHLPKYARKLLSFANLQALLATPDGSLADWVAGEYRRARNLLRGHPHHPLVGPDEEARRRERLLARRLRALACRYARVVYLGGWEHLEPWQDEDSLTHLLAPLAPSYLLLDEADG